MEHRIERLEQKADDVQETQTQILVEVAEIKSDLREHMRRTAANEEAVLLLKDIYEQNKELLLSRIRPIENLISQMKFLGGALAIVCSVLMAAYELGFFKLFL